MIHEMSYKKITVEDTAINFQSIYTEEYFPTNLLKEISKANMLIIPDKFDRNKKSGYLFPETTCEFLDYARKEASDMFIPDIAADDNSFGKMELHSAVITVATFIVTNVAFPIALSVVANYLYDQMKKHHREGNGLSCKLNIIVSDGNVNKKISYEGPAGSAEEALKLAVKEAFDNKEDNNIDE